jgi:hypothetical protein
MVVAMGLARSCGGCNYHPTPPASTYPPIYPPHQPKTVSLPATAIGDCTAALGTQSAGASRQQKKGYADLMVYKIDRNNL